MREILFRGKRTNKKGWMYGYYSFNPTTNIHWIKTPRTIFNNWDTDMVDPSTVGQYTGLKDKTGKQIFEGDIVSIEDGEFWVFSFGNCGGIQNVAHEVGYTGFYLSPLSPSAIHHQRYGQRDDPVYYLNSIGLCVIGNIYDNPELLEDRQEGE